MARVNPTRMELTRMKKRLSTAARGHKLLKDKQDEMARRFLYYIRRNRALRQEVEALLSGAMSAAALAGAEMGEDALAEALFLPAAAVPAQFSTENLMNLEVPSITLEGRQAGAGLPYGPAFSSEHLDRAVLGMETLMPKLLELAQCEKICDMLADEMERTRRRVNALEYVMIPDLKKTIKSITMKLEDNERGNLTRLMKVKDMMVQAARAEIGG